MAHTTSLPRLYRHREHPPCPARHFCHFLSEFGAGITYGGLGYAFAGAVLITIGMFFPCSLFVIAGHNLLGRLVRNKFLAPLFDRICGSVVGVIAIIAVQLLSGSINSQAGRTLVTEAQQQQQQCESASRNPLAAVIFMLALIVLYKFTNKYAVLVLVFCGAVAGQFPFM
ncbi:hypothetical protein FRC16_006549 [Serendipita sp. 398]|nr:hypothetical protein FRC16_006549 [Serendipita sp. 398]